MKYCSSLQTCIKMNHNDFTVATYDASKPIAIAIAMTTTLASGLLHMWTRSKGQTCRLCMTRWSSNETLRGQCLSQFIVNSKFSRRIPDTAPAFQLLLFKLKRVDNRCMPLMDYWTIGDTIWNKRWLLIVINMCDSFSVSIGGTQHLAALERMAAVHEDQELVLRSALWGQAPQVPAKETCSSPLVRTAWCDQTWCEQVSEEHWIPQEAARKASIESTCVPCFCMKLTDSQVHNDAKNITYRF